MSDLNVCLVCLCKGVKMYDYNKYKLKQYYVEDMALKTLDGLPQRFCYICAAMLHKFHKFKQKCHIGQQTLKKLLSWGPITSASLSHVDRQSNNLQTPLGVITLSKRVKIFTLDAEKVFTDSLKVEPMDEDQTDYSSDHSLEYNNMSDYNMEEEVESSNIDEQNVNVDEQNVNVDEQNVNVDEQNVNVVEQNVNGQSDNVNSGKIDVVIQNLNVNMDRTLTDLDESRHPNKADKLNPEDQKLALYMRGLVKTAFSREGKETKVKEVKIFKRKVYIIKTKMKNNIVTKAIRIPLIKEVNTVKDKPVTQIQQLDPEHWFKISMTEQEAKDNFIARSRDPKYLAAAYKCEKCYTGFSKEDILSRHIKLVHDKSRGPFECHLCCRRYNRKGLLTKHKHIHYHKYKCLRCDLTFFFQSSAITHNDLHSGFKKKCEKCSYVFRHRTTYCNHVRIFHRSEHVCTLCGASFVSQKGLQQHNNLRHIIDNVNPDEAGENTFCEKCDIQFRTREAFNEHFKHSAKHADFVPTIEATDEDEGDMPAYDIPANTTFESMMKLRNKKRLTTTCFVCNEVFVSYSQYKRHHLAEHKDVPVPDTLKMCEVCGIKTTNMTLHMNTHTRKKTYPCPTCGLKFTLKYNIKRHMLTHTVREKSVPKHKCPLCEKLFTEKFNMNTHYRTIHLQQPNPKRNRKLLMRTKIEDCQYLPASRGRQLHD